VREPNLGCSASALGQGPGNIPPALGELAFSLMRLSDDTGSGLSTSANGDFTTRSSATHDAFVRRDGRPRTARAVRGRDAVGEARSNALGVGEAKARARCRVNDIHNNDDDNVVYHLISSAEPAATAPGSHSGAVRSTIGHGGTVPPGLSKHRSTDQRQASRRERARGRAASLRIEVGDNGRNPQPCAKFRVAFTRDPGRDVTALMRSPP
jgi:hypothetical protein